MNEKDQELRDAVGELVTPRQPGSHPEPDELAAYHAGELSRQREEQIQDHLVVCHECAGLLLDLDGLADADFGAGSGLAAKEAVWNRLRQEIESGARRAAAPAPVVPIRRGAYSSPRRLQALAAALLAATLGLSAWVASLQRNVAHLQATVAELSEVPNASMLDLSSQRVRSAASSVPTVSGSASVFGLRLNPAKLRTFDRYRYRVEILDAKGKRVFDRGGFQPDDLGSFRLGGLPRRKYGPGDYQIRLYGTKGTSEELIDEFAFHVEGSP